MRELEAHDIIGEHPGVAFLLKTTDRVHAVETHTGDVIVLADDRYTWDDLLEAVPDAYRIVPRVVHDPLEAWTGYFAYFQARTLKGRMLYLGCPPVSTTSSQSIVLAAN